LVLALRDETVTYFEIVLERPFGLENFAVKPPRPHLLRFCGGFYRTKRPTPNLPTQNTLIERAVL